MKGIIALAFLMAFVKADSYYTDPWNILPKTEDWKPIIRSFESNDQVPAYVGIYVQPFRELQAAERRVNTPSTVIKNSVIAMLNMGQQAIANLSITEGSFNNRDKKAFQQALRKAMEPFRASSGPGSLSPVFSKRAVGQFFYQRFDDMIVASKKYSDFVSRCKDYARFLRMAQVQMKQWDAGEFAFLVPRNLDLDLVEVYSTKVIQTRYNNATLTDRDIQDLRYKLRSLGNNGNTLLASTAVLLITILSSTFMLVL